MFAGTCYNPSCLRQLTKFWLDPVQSEVSVASRIGEQAIKLVYPKGLHGPDRSVLSDGLCSQGTDSGVYAVPWILHPDSAVLLEARRSLEVLGTLEEGRPLLQVSSTRKGDHHKGLKNMPLKFLEPSCCFLMLLLHIVIGGLSAAM